MDGPAIVAAYHDLYQVEVFAALAVAREAQARSGLSINKVLKVLRPLRSAAVTIGAQQVTAQPRIPAEARPFVTDLGWGGHYTATAQAR